MTMTSVAGPTESTAPADSKPRSLGLPTLRDMSSPTRLIGLALIVAAIGFGSGSLVLGLWNYGMPGLGLTPLIASIGLLPVGIAMVLDPVAQDDGPFQAIPLVTGLALCGYGAGLAWLGLALPSFAFIFLWSRLLYRRPWIASLAAAIGITAGMYLLFVKALGMPIELWPA